MLPQILLFSTLGSLGVIAGSALLLLFPETVRQRWLPGMISFATGTLLGTALLAMLPASLARAPAKSVCASLLAGIVLFFLLEKLVLWRHSHETHQPSRRPVGPLILIGDAMHNFVDGVMIAATFLASTSLGISTALAVIAHEIPQEVGDFAILLESGYSRRKALLLNSLSAAATLPGALVAYFWLEPASEGLPHVLALSAASFIYVAMADLIPELHRRARPVRPAVLQFLLLLAGIGTVAKLHG